MRVLGWRRACFVVVLNETTAFIERFAIDSIESLQLNEEMMSNHRLRTTAVANGQILALNSIHLDWFLILL